MAQQAGVEGCSPGGIDSERAQKMVADWLENSSGRWLSDVEAAALLECYGVAVVEFRSVLSEDEAVEAANAVGYPVAVKATGEMWRHRPDLGGVRLDLSGPESVRLAYRDLAAASGEPLLHVQKMATKGIGVWSESKTTRRSVR
ncbi:hypothetical protein GCM10020255_077070 [Rhodococcus baikonurensis]